MIRAILYTLPDSTTREEQREIAQKLYEASKDILRPYCAEKGWQYSEPGKGDAGFMYDIKALRFASGDRALGVLLGGQDE